MNIEILIFWALLFVFFFNLVLFTVGPKEKKTENILFIYATDYGLTVVRGPFTKNGMLIDFLLTSLELPALLLLVMVLLFSAF